MNFDWFKDLAAIAQTGSFSKASMAQNISQPALTRRIKALEEWAEQPLVDRNKRPVSLTEAGYAFLSTCTDFFDTIDRQRMDLLSQSVASQQTVIRFAAQHSIAWHFFPDWLRDLEVQFGPISTRIRAEDLADCVDSFLAQDVDFLMAYDVIHAEFSQELPHRIDAISVGADALVPVCAPDEYGNPTFDCDSDKSLPLISYGRVTPLGRLFERDVRPKLSGQNIQLIYENSMSSTLRNWALKGVGVCWLPRRLISSDLENQRLVIAGNKELWVDLNISLFSHRKDRFGLAENIWRHLNAA